MNNNFFIKITIFFIIELIGIGLIFKNQSFLIFGLFSAVISLLIFFNPKNTKNISNIKNLFKESYLYSIINSNFFVFLKYFFVHWGFVLSFIAVIFAIFNFFVLKQFGINLNTSLLFFILSIFFCYDDILKGNIYLGKQKISSKDILFIMSIILTLSMFVYLKKIPTIDNLFFSVISGFGFYIIMIYSLGYKETNMKLFKSKIINIYLFLLVCFTILFVYSKIPYLHYKNKTNSIKTQNKTITNQENTQKNKIEKTDNFTTYIAPNQKLYDIHETTTGARFLGYKAQRKFFKNSKEAIKAIDLANPPISENKQIINNLSGNSNTDLMVGQLINMFEEATNEPLSEDRKDIILTGEDVTYYDIIPFIINKFNLNSKNKAKIKFNNIPYNDTNYDYFKTAYYYKMIGRDFNPNTKVQCKTVAVFIGLAENLNTNYTSTDVFSVFWELVDKKYNISACCKESDYIKESNITCIFE